MRYFPAQPRPGSFTLCLCPERGVAGGWTPSATVARRRPASLSRDASLRINAAPDAVRGAVRESRFALGVL